MTDLDEALSRLLSGDLEPDQEAQLFADLATDPALRRRLDVVRRIPDALAMLPSSPLPEALRERLIAIPGGQRWPWRGPAIGALVAAAAILIVLALRQADEPEVLASGVAYVEGQHQLLAGDVHVAVDGAAWIEVEPPAGAERRPGQEVEMRRRLLVAALAGSLVTVTVYEGSARLSPPSGEVVTALAGQSLTLGPPPTPSDPLPTPQEEPPGRTDTPSQGSTPAHPPGEGAPQGGGPLQGEEQTERTPDQLLTSAEEQFNGGDALGALQLYREIVEDHPDHRYAPYALYKLAWTKANVDDLPGAIEDMQLLLDWYAQGVIPPASSADQLREAAEGDLQTLRSRLEDEADALPR